MKLHHKFGSSDLKTLHAHGYTASYEEVLRYRKSAAKFVSENVQTLHQLMGLFRTVGLVFGWYDNFDLLVSTSNGRRETHTMETEFQFHPAGILEVGQAYPGLRKLEIPRLSSKQAKTVGTNRSVQLHYTGSKKVTPPLIVASKTNGIAYTDACAR